MKRRQKQPELRKAELETALKQRIEHRGVRVKGSAWTMRSRVASWDRRRWR
jgi:hypothetical protein